MRRRFPSLGLAFVLLVAAACESGGTAPPPPGSDSGMRADAGKEAAGEAAPPPDAGPDAAPLSPLPEIPAYTPYDQNVLMVSGQKAQVPIIPPARATNDGRVALSLSEGTLTFSLNRPEVFTSSFSAQPAGVSIVDPSQDVTLPTGKFESHVPASDGALRFHTICDDTSVANPHPCIGDASKDCYQVTVVAAYNYNGTAVRPFEVWSTPIIVRVANPKTPSAYIAKIDTGTPVKSPTQFMGAAFNELNTTEDGRVLVGDERDTTTIVYAVNPPGGAYGPCDARGWTTLNPISQMNSDPAMIPYGVAAYPLRDMENNLVPPGANLNGIYPWMDRKGRNICFATYVDPLYYADSKGNVTSRFPVTGCPAGMSCATPTASDLTNGFEDLMHRQGIACAGLWTHGKAVMLTGRLNSADFGLTAGPSGESMREIQLYADHTGKDTKALGRVTVGNNFFIHYEGFPGDASNSAFVDSIEHRFNYLPNMIPLSLSRSDVVWLVSSGKATEEVAFDPYVNPNGFILSSGLASVTNDGAGGPSIYNDGFDRPNMDNFNSGTVGSGVTRAVHVQNAATAVSPEVVKASGGALTPSAGRWRVPAYGLGGGDVRIEPVNAGGVAGIERGLWLSGAGSVTYAIPAQPDATTLASTPWYAGIFLDTRPAPGDGPATVRRIFTFPDGSVLEMEGRGKLRFGQPASLTTVTLPSDAPAVDWVHLAFVSTPKSVALYENGFLFATIATPKPVLRIAEGKLVLGAAPATPGFRGWIDRFEVYAEAPNPEIACNRAMGTLVGLSATTTHGALYDKARLYPASSHAAVSALLPSTGRFPLYACFNDTTSEFGANLNDIPAGGTSVRTSLLFPEGPLVWNAPRPDSSKNAFCLDCHVPDHPHTLTPAALVLNASLTEYQDPRRRPLQPFPFLSGDVPANLFGPSMPPTASGAGVNVDMYLYP